MIPVIESIDMLLGILIIGFMMFGYISKARIFYLAASAILMFLAVAYVDYMALFLPLLGASIFLFVFTFMAQYED